MNYLREIVSGPKNRYKEDGYNLDLTYICPRLIAMSFPASGIETLYRNSIDKVSKMIKQHHENSYYIFNVSGRKYDYQKFEGRVKDYEWEDHHSPPINTLFIICNEIHYFLMQNDQNVVIIHCLAGKGRTGTIICCYLLFSGRMQNPQEALAYYAKKRFYKEGLGVNQPCQIRYVYYFHQVFSEQDVYPKIKYIKSIELFGKPKYNDDGCKPFFEFFYVQNKQLIFTTKKSYSDQEKFTENSSQLKIEFKEQFFFCGDVLLKMHNNGPFKNKKMIRASFSTAFIPENNIYQLKLSELSPSQLLKDQKYPKDFMIRIIFDSICECNFFNYQEKKCKVCFNLFEKEQNTWDQIYSILKSYQRLDKQKQSLLLFKDQKYDDVDQILDEEKEKLQQKGIQLCPFQMRDRKSKFNEYIYEQFMQQYNNNMKGSNENLEQEGKILEQSSSDESNDDMSLQSERKRANVVPIFNFKISFKEEEKQNS